MGAEVDEGDRCEVHWVSANVVSANVVSANVVSANVVMTVAMAFVASMNAPAYRLWSPRRGIAR